jgi:cytochrome c
MHPVERARATAAAIGIGLGLTCVPALAHAGEGDPIDLLVFSRTAGFRHASIEAGVAAVEQIASQRGWTVVASEDPAVFQPATLGEFEVIVFLNTTGDILDDAQQDAFVGWVQAGGGFVGIHSATDTEMQWPWYVGLVGTSFADHPAPQMATLHVVDATHPATTGLPDPWVRFDEWYNFLSNPSAEVDVLLRLDETTYTGGTMGREHPIAWSHEYDGGRAFYTALGHTIESWREPEFLAHVAGGLEWAVGARDPSGGSSSTGDGASDGVDDTSGDAATTGGAADTTSPPMGTTGDPGPASTTAITASDAGEDTTAVGMPQQGDDGGCGCTTRRRTAATWFALALPLLALRGLGARAGLRRRKRRARH